MPDLLAAGKVAERRRNRRTLALGAAAVVLVAGAATVASSVLTDDESNPVAGGVSPVLTLPEWDMWPQAEIAGVLNLQDGCLYIGDHAAVWPSGSTWDASEQAVLYGSLTIPVGDHVQGGGGHYTLDIDAGSVMGEATWTAAQQCARQVSGDDVVVVLPDTVRAADEPAMTVTPLVARPGEVVSLGFPTEHPRGVGFVLISRSDGIRYELTSNAMQPNREPTWTSRGRGWLDIGISGPGPDKVLIPPPAAPGEYDLCTGNASIEQCVSITVSSVRAE
ncbi:MAG: hypothetical protein Q8O61_05620 [Nocardioides sp.]|nr:hypothetical protein [Nocardioides sp.]